MSDLERLRLVILGGPGVGKSCIVKRFLFKSYSDKYRATIEDLYNREYDFGNVTLKVTISWNRLHANTKQFSWEIKFIHCIGWAGSGVCAGVCIAYWERRYLQCTSCILKVEFIIGKSNQATCFHFYLSYLRWQVENHGFQCWFESSVFVCCSCAQVSFACNACHTNTLAMPMRCPCPCRIPRSLKMSIRIVD